MWRYRDPRSMRALFVDIGQAEGQVQQYSRLLGRTYQAADYMLLDVPLISAAADASGYLPLLRLAQLHEEGASR